MKNLKENIIDSITPAKPKNKKTANLFNIVNADLNRDKQIEKDEHRAQEKEKSLNTKENENRNDNNNLKKEVL